MAATKSLVSLTSRVTLVFVFMTLVVTQAQAQNCSIQLSSLNVCASSLAHGAASPNQACCGALEAVDHTCLCNTLRIAAQLPSQCNLPALSCSAN